MLKRQTFPIRNFVHLCTENLTRIKVVLNRKCYVKNVLTHITKIRFITQSDLHRVSSKVCYKQKIPIPLRKQNVKKITFILGEIMPKFC